MMLCMSNAIWSVLTCVCHWPCQIAQLRHELSMRDDLLHFYASTEELEAASEARST